MYGRYFGPGANLGVPAGYSSRRSQKLIVASDAATTPARRRGRIAALNHYLTANAVWVWLFDSYDYAAVTSNVQGFTLPPDRDLKSLASSTVS